MKKFCGLSPQIAEVPRDKWRRSAEQFQSSVILEIVLDGRACPVTLKHPQQRKMTTASQQRQITPTMSAATGNSTTATTVRYSSAGARAAAATDDANVARDYLAGAVQDTEAANDNDQQVATPANWGECNETWCDLDRLGKAMLAAAISAGTALATARQELGDSFLNFAALRTPWQAPEAEAAIRFSREVGLQPEGLSPAVAVPLARVLGAVTLLGQLYAAEVEHANDVAH